MKVETMKVETMKVETMKVKSADLRAAAISARIPEKLWGTSRVVEVGVYQGALSSRLLVRDDIRLTMVDSWTDTHSEDYVATGDFHSVLSAEEQAGFKAIAEARVRFAGEAATIEHCTSVQAANKLSKGEMFDMVFLDADHSYSGVLADLEAWYPITKRIGGHDYSWPGVRLAVDEYAEWHGLSVERDYDDTWFYIVPGDRKGPRWACLVSVACVWYGDKYSFEHVMSLYDQVKNFLHLPFEFVVLTNNVLPENTPHDMRFVELQGSDYEPGWWAKMELFRNWLWRRSQRVIYFDLDVMIVDDLEDFVYNDGIIQDWHYPCFNSSVMSWRADTKFTHRLWDEWCSERESIVRTYPGDQDFIYATDQNLPTFPREWCRSYRQECVEGVPPGTKVVVFHGQPKPWDIETGWVTHMKGMGVPNFVRCLNTPIETMLGYRKQNLGCPEGTPEWNQPRALLQRMVEVQDRELVIVAGGPSARDCISFIDPCYQDVWGLNGAALMLQNEFDVTPTAVVILDSKPECVAFVHGLSTDVLALLSTTVNPLVVEACYSPIQFWDPYIAGSPGKIQIAGGGTVGSKAINLAYILGYRHVTLLGYDSSYDEDGQHHAYPQSWNDTQHTTTVLRGEKRYKSALWMVAQVRDLLEQLPVLEQAGMKIQLLGRGLFYDSTIGN